MSALDPFALGGRQSEASPVAKFDFVAAEAEMEALQDLEEEFADAGDDTDKTLSPIANRWTAMETAICREAPASLADVAVKLRVLADTGSGMEVSVFDGYNSSLAQVLAFLDGLIQCREFDSHDYVAQWISRLRKLTRDQAEATNDELDSMRSLLRWVESKVRRSRADWPNRRAMVEGLTRSVA